LREAEFARVITTNEKRLASFSILGLISLHTATAYFLYVLIGEALPRFHILESGLMAVFCALFFCGIFVLAVTNRYHHGKYRGEVIDHKYYKRKRKSKALRTADILGLLFVTVGLFGALHLLIFLGFSAFGVATWALAFALLIISGLFGITMGYHRYATHKAFECGKIFGCFLLFCGALSCQGTIKKWATEHLIHHARTEIEQEDPHTAVEGFVRSHIGWLVTPYKYNERIWKMFSSGFDSNKLFAIQEKFYRPLYMLSLFGPFFIVGSLGFVFGDGFAVTEGFKAVLLAGFFRVFLILHITLSVNSVSHTWGSQPYEDRKTGDSTDVWMLAPFSFGENLQNIHHLLPSVASYWVKWYYPDITGVLTQSLSWFNRFSFLKWIGLPYNLKLIRESEWRYISSHSS